MIDRSLKCISGSRTRVFEPVLQELFPPSSFEMERKPGSRSLAAAALCTLATLLWLPAASASYVKLPWSNSPSPSAGWKQAHATFYGDETAQETMGGACGYGNLHSSGYGTMTAALSSVLFNNGYGCGQCFQIKCTDSKYCFPGSITVTATNLCPANWYKPTNNGGWCNPPRAHFDLSKPAFMRIAFWKAGIVPVSYRRVPCQRKGQINFKLEGNKWWLIVFVTNVAGSGDIKSMSVKGDKTSWIPMSRNWGVGFQVFKQLQGQSLSFKITCFSTGKTTTINNVVPSNWRTGQTYSGGQM